MAMPQRDETIEEIKRLDALLEYLRDLPEVKQKCYTIGT